MLHTHLVDFKGLAGAPLLRKAYELFGPELAVVSSFGTEAAALLRLVVEVDCGMPVLFIDTRMHFPETLRYKEDLSRALGLTNVISIGPSGSAVHRIDPSGTLQLDNDEACCNFRKVQPLKIALEPYVAWANGRKRHQGGQRADLRSTECDGYRIKINPLALWTTDEVEEAFSKYGLPRHPLAIRYKRILCNEFCSSDRKLECGIHTRLQTQ